MVAIAAGTGLEVAGATFCSWLTVSISSLIDDTSTPISARVMASPGRLATLMPLVGRAAVDGYLRSVALWLAQRQGLGEAEQEQADLASMGIRAETVTLGDAPLARTLGTLLGSTGARP